MDNWGLGKNSGCTKKRPNLFEESKQVLAHTNCQGHEDPQEQRLKKGLNLTFKQRIRQDYVIQKQKHKNYKQEHDMCKTNVKIYFY